MSETRSCWGFWGLEGGARRGDLVRARLPGAGGAIVAAYTVNELPAEDRSALLERLLDAAGRGARILIVEPIARRVSPWWAEWAVRFDRSDEWRFEVELPASLRKLDKAAGLDHRELTARSLLVGS